MEHTPDTDASPIRGTVFDLSTMPPVSLDPFDIYGIAHGRPGRDAVPSPTRPAPSSDPNR